MLTVLVGQLFKTLFFGRLREAEVEHLYERSWCAPAEIQPRPGSAERPGLLELPPQPVRADPLSGVHAAPFCRYAITETCLAMTIFREEFNVRFVGLFTALLFIKIFHWLMQDRISYMEQTPAVPLRTHARMLFLMALLFALDSSFLYHAVSVSLKRGPSVLLLFAFEYLILASTVCATFSKYALHINDIRLQGRWDDKGVYLFYLELVTDMFHMLVYLAFFVLICTYYGLPLHIMRGPRAPLSNPADEPHRVPPWHDRVASRTDASLPFARPRTWQTFTSPAARFARAWPTSCATAASLTTCRSGSPTPPRRSWTRRTASASSAASR